MRSERKMYTPLRNTLNGKYWEVRGEKSGVDGESRFKESELKSFLTFSQGQLSGSAWTALEGMWAMACWSKM